MRASTSGAMLAFTEPDDAMVVPVYAHTLERLGWTGVIASRTAPDTAVRKLLERDAIGPLHFWNRLSLSPHRDAIAQLYEIESRDKRVEIFFYYGLPKQRDCDPDIAVPNLLASHQVLVIRLDVRGSARSARHIADIQRDAQRPRHLYGDLLLESPDILQLTLERLVP